MSEEFFRINSSLQAAKKLVGLNNDICYIISPKILTTLYKRQKILEFGGNNTTVFLFIDSNAIEMKENQTFDICKMFHKARFVSVVPNQFISIQTWKK